MGATNSFETSLLNHIFTNANIANIGDANGLIKSTANGNLFVALHTADPTETGDQANECTYTSYARVAVPRTSAEWTVSGNSATNANAVTFPQANGGSETATHFSILTASTSGDMLFSNALTANLAISNGITPSFAASNLTVTAE
jgi:hypothetical protein